MGGGAGRYAVLGSGAVRVCWILGDGTELTLEANLDPMPLRLGRSVAGRPLWIEGRAGPGELGPWSVAWTLSGEAA